MSGRCIDGTPTAHQGDLEQERGEFNDVDDAELATAKRDVELSDDDEFYNQEKEEIMDNMKTARYQIETQKHRQSAILCQRKAQHQTREQKANSVIHQAEAADRMKSKDHERQIQLIKSRLDDRKRRADLAEKSVHQE